VSSPVNRGLVLAAMIFAVAMTFIDQTIVAIAAPDLQGDLSLSPTGVQWIINGYLLSLSALFAFGGRLADIAGHRRMVVIGVIIFAASSALCGATPTGGIGEAWIITFRVIQGAGAALMFPAALAIVIASYPLEDRGKAMAIFFGIAGGLTSVGPIAGGYLTEWTWRAIFWVNIPAAIIALVLIAISKPEDERHPAPIDFRGTVLIAAGMGIAVLGLQQASVWGWGSVATIGCLVVGLAILAVFVRFELRTSEPLLRMRIFEDRRFAMQNVVLFLLMICFVPLFFFASTYAQVSLGDSASNAGLYLLTFFAGFAIAAQVGGRILDERGARFPVVIGSAIAAVGFYLWAHELTGLNYDDQWTYIVVAGAGVGLVLGPSNTDAVNRAPRSRYGEATGITQTVRNFGSSLGLAVLGTILILENKSNLESALGRLGLPKGKSDAIASSITNGGGGAGADIAARGGKRADEFLNAVQHSYALSSRTIFYAMAGVMAVCFIVALIALPGGKMEVIEETGPRG
jgi:EmrB/QacA subfamily drug resistance transporter